MIPQLWKQIEKFIFQQANRRARQLNGFGGVAADELYQAGFIGFLDAIQSYDASKQGLSLAGLLST